ncbi:hypothetical protein CYMTET_24996 [Cymbomonas tetramitiformis]|uniref:Phytanoyl-CoA dioxygenase n=1 Tax=Cymbomonas tetramitiformis TaxID=36881 RepID=A0AAE0KZM1_9CHLO|nr:hypothetical protein CYMTET_24996 [Cymbomonas tetramitiformis]
MPHSSDYSIDFVPNSHVEHSEYVADGYRTGKVPPLAARVVVPKDHLLLWSSRLIHRAAEHPGTSVEDRLSTFMYVRAKGSNNMMKANINYPAAGLPAPLSWKGVTPDLANASPLGLNFKS